MMSRMVERLVTRRREPAVLSALLAMSFGLALPAVQATVYDFEDLQLGGLAGQDNWLSEPSLGEMVIRVDTTGNNTKVAWPILGVASGWFAYLTRVNDAGFGYSPLTGDAAMIQFDANGQAAAGFALGKDLDGNGLLSRANGEIGPAFGTFSDTSDGGVTQFFVEEGGLRTSDPDFSPTFVTPLTTPQRCCNDPEDWYRLQLRIDLTANGGAGSGSLYYMNLSRGDTTFLPVAELQNLDMALDTMATGAGPESWDAMWLLTQSDGGQRLPGLDNLLPDVGGSFASDRVEKDFNADGTSDIFLRNSSGATAIWEMADLFRSEAIFPGGIGTEWATSGIGYFDSDATADVLYRRNDGATAIWVMNDANIEDITYPGGAGLDWTIVENGDYDGDGSDDVFFFNDNGATAVWLMDDALRDEVTYPGGVDLSWGVVGSGDFNGDDTDDVLFLNNNGSTAIWLFSDGLRNAQTFPGGLAAGWSVAAVGDYDGDGTDDIFCRSASGTNAIWLMSNGTRSDIVFPGGLPTNWMLVDSGDYNADGTDDILYRDSGGATLIWAFDDAAVVGTSFPGGAGTDWEVQ